MRIACSASNSRPVSSICIACLRDTARPSATCGVRHHRPMLTPGVANRALRAAQARSQVATSCAPAAVATPRTLAITGRGWPTMVIIIRLQRLDSSLENAGTVALEQFGEIVARAEHPVAGGLDDDHVHIGIVGGGVERGLQCIDQRQRQCVAGARPVQPQRQHVRVARDQQDRVGRRCFGRRCFGLHCGALRRWSVHRSPPLAPARACHAPAAAVHLPVRRRLLQGTGGTRRLSRGPCHSGPESAPAPCVGAGRLAPRHAAGPHCGAGGAARGAAPAGTRTNRRRPG